MKQFNDLQSIKKEECRSGHLRCRNQKTSAPKNLPAQPDQAKELIGCSTVLLRASPQFPELLARRCDLQPVGFDGEAQPATDIVLQPLDLLALKLDYLAAVLADDMAVPGMLGIIWVVELVVFPEVHLPNQAALRQQWQRAVNRRSRNRLVPPLRPVQQVLCREMFLRAEHRLNDRAPRSGHPHISLRQEVQEPLPGAFLVRVCHARNVGREARPRQRSAPRPGACAARTTVKPEPAQSRFSRRSLAPNHSWAPGGSFEPLTLFSGSPCPICPGAPQPSDYETHHQALAQIVFLHLRGQLREVRYDPPAARRPALAAHREGLFVHGSRVIVADLLSRRNVAQGDQVTVIAYPGIRRTRVVDEHSRGLRVDILVRAHLNRHALRGASPLRFCEVYQRPAKG